MPMCSTPWGEIGGRTVGLVGFGQSAQRLAPVLQALGAQVIYTARGENPASPYPYRSLEDLLAEADIVSLHAPLTQETRALMGPAAFARIEARRGADQHRPGRTGG